MKLDNGPVNMIDAIYVATVDFLAQKKYFYLQKFLERTNLYCVNLQSKEVS
jgi:hypothetical protein